MVERALFGFHPSRISYWEYYLVSLAIIFLSIFLTLSFFGILPFDISIMKEYDIYIFPMISILGLIPISIVEIKVKTDTYIFTDERIIEKKGLLSVKESSVNWEKISNHALSQSILDRLFKVGTIKIWSMGIEHEPEIVIKKSYHIKRINEMLDKLIQRK